MAECMKCLPYKCESLSSHPRNPQTAGCSGTFGCNPHTPTERWKVETGEEHRPASLAYNVRKRGGRGDPVPDKEEGKD